MLGLSLAWQLWLALTPLKVSPVCLYFLKYDSYFLKYILAYKEAVDKIIEEEITDDCHLEDPKSILEMFALFSIHQHHFERALMVIDCIEPTNETINLKVWALLKLDQIFEAISTIEDHLAANEGKCKFSNSSTWPMSSLHKCKRTATV